MTGVPCEMRRTQRYMRRRRGHVTTEAGGGPKLPEAKGHQGKRLGCIFPWSLQRGHGPLDLGLLASRTARVNVCGLTPPGVWRFVTTPSGRPHSGDAAVPSFRRQGCVLRRKKAPEQGKGPFLISSSYVPIRRHRHLSAFLPSSLTRWPRSSGSRGPCWCPRSGRLRACVVLGQRAVCL